MLSVTVALNMYEDRSSELDKVSKPESRSRVKGSPDDDSSENSI